MNVSHADGAIPNTERPMLRRSTTDKAITGVLGGLAHHFGVQSGVLRILFVIAAVMNLPLMLIVYVAAFFLMPREGETTRRHRGRGRCGHRRRRGRATPPPPPGASDFRHDRATAGESNVDREIRLERLNGDFEGIEKRIRDLENHVTSREYILQRKFAELED
jgi:phage shock protein C